MEMGIMGQVRGRLEAAQKALQKMKQQAAENQAVLSIRA
jgi:hypothetical protein